MNHYLTSTATEYIPDTDRMLFTVGFSGDGFKKLYHDPLKRRPVSLAVDPEDLIVSNMATDIESCGRVTHRMRLRRSQLRRMQIVGAYRDVHIQQAAVADTPDAVKQEIAEVVGAKVEPQRPKDVDYTLYECYCELDIDDFAPPQFKGKALPLPYRVTIEKDSKQVLEISRNWKKDDPLCQPRQTFVQYPFIPALGFYSLGFLHLLGNTTLALTAATREMLDAGMFANFPGFVYAKQVGRQLTNQFRCPPGGGVAIDLPAGMKVQDVVMPLPYKEVGPAFPAFIQHVEQNGRQLAMVSNAPVAEGKQDAPVGTTLALIEQQTKVLGSAFKRLHIAQSKEFKLLVELFEEDPEAMWRHNKRPQMAWTKNQFRQALKRYELVPVADPNNPTSLHRMAKAAMLKTLQAANPAIYDPIAVDRRVLTMAAIDPEGLFKGPQPAAPDPMMMLLQMKVQLEQLKLQQKDKELQLKAATAAMQQQGQAADRSSQERIELLKQQIVGMEQQGQMIMDRLKLNAQMIMHVHGQMTKTAGGPPGKPGGDGSSPGMQGQIEHKPTSTGAAD
jgi:anti-sigma28 factor (negative regulator of flagellin synthesis)